MTHLKPGDPAPHFHLKDQNSNGWSLDDVAGKWVVLYFYPQDDTPGCTKEACAFKDLWGEYQSRDVKVFGISSDTYDTHSKFVDKYDLPLELLEDPGREAISAYGVEKQWTNKEGGEQWGARRVTFLIDPDGRIAKVYENVRPEQHAQEILGDLDGLMQTA